MFNDSGVNNKLHDRNNCKDSTSEETNSCRSNQTSPLVWMNNKLETPPAKPARGRRRIGINAMTTELAPWFKNVLTQYQPTNEVLDLVQTFANELYDYVDKKRKSSLGQHDLDAIAYPQALEIGPAIT